MVIARKTTHSIKHNYGLDSFDKLIRETNNDTMTDLYKSILVNEKYNEDIDKLNVMVNVYFHMVTQGNMPTPKSYQKMELEIA